MNVKLTEDQFEYLKINFLPSHMGIAIHPKIQGNAAHLKVDDELADEVTEWASERLQEIGFDANYALTRDGKMLESLIDIFCPNNYPDQSKG